MGNCHLQVIQSNQNMKMRFCRLAAKRACFDDSLGVPYPSSYSEFWISISLIVIQTALPTSVNSISKQQPCWLLPVGKSPALILAMSPFSHFLARLPKDLVHYWKPPSNRKPVFSGHLVSAYLCLNIFIYNSANLPGTQITLRALSGAAKEISMYPHD